MADFDANTPLNDSTLHAERFPCDDGSALLMIVDRLTAAGVLINNGAFYPIEKSAIVSAFPMSEELFLAIDEVYHRETHRRLRVTDHVESLRALAFLNGKIRDMVREELNLRDGNS